jgi:selenide,water dikinase
MNSHGPHTKELLLVGAGHSHVQVLRSFLMERPVGCRVTLVVDRPIAVYSGMVPGFVCGQYRAEELEIDALPLARRAGARVVMAVCKGIDAERRQVMLVDRPPLRYDLCSFDVGSTVGGLDLPGILEHAIPTRPIGRFVEQVEVVVDRAREMGASRDFHVVVVGGGAGGVEVAATLEARLRAAGAQPRVTLVHAGARVLSGQGEALVARVERAFERRGIPILAGRRVASATKGSVTLDDGSTLPTDALVWVSGAVSHPLFAPSGLATDSRGFVLTRPTLQVQDYDDLFAVGDCATLADFPETPKAGLYAVRQGPLLARNIRAVLAGRPLKRYRPQADFLNLLNLGDGTAIGAKKGITFEGRWVMRWKDWIDRRFMDRFQFLRPDGREGPALATLPPMPAGMEPVCGGCAAKLSQDALDRAISRLPSHEPAPEVVLGLDEADDAVAYQTPSGDLVLASVDFFRAFIDDPYLVGRVAALNAVSDLDSKGVPARWAQALVAVPLSAGEQEGEDVLFQVLSGARDTFDPIGVRLLGGHTSKAEELQVGFAVQGAALGSQRLPRRRGNLAVGQRLILSRPLGTGVLFHADMAGRARGPWIEAALAAMLLGNAAAQPVALRAGAATDITGFGLAGHLGSMFSGSGLCARLELSALPALPGAVELLALGERSHFHEANARIRRVLAVAPLAALDPRLQLLFDPQTAGGLLLVFSPEETEGALVELRAAGYGQAAVVGEIIVPTVEGAVAEVVP